ncbi:MAG: hypothetical protein A3J38_04945 [Gammaproteobacteria bacterium RIFCSPHIGHO2_12_FULL_45_9]|nr:MAG: hypothetical protein A3J38_04945 [Gammaproteobacteria bacterium RIFCSPHIGHO2_12_FULL_45_9]
MRSSKSVLAAVISTLIVTYSLAHAEGIQSISLSDPSPAIPTRMAIGESESFTYTLTSYFLSHYFPSVSITGSPAVPYADNAVIIEAGSCGRYWHGSCQFTVTLTPTQQESPTLSQSLSIGYGGFAPLTTSFSLSVSAPVQAQIRFSIPSPSIPSSLDVGSDNTYTYTIANAGPDTTLPIIIKLSGNYGADAVSLTNDNCSGQQVSAGDTCTFGIEIQPLNSDLKSGIQQKLDVNYGGISTIEGMINVAITNNS